MQLCLLDPEEPVPVVFAPGQIEPRQKAQQSEVDLPGGPAGLALSWTDLGARCPWWARVPPGRQEQTLNPRLGDVLVCKTLRVCAILLNHGL